MRKSIVVIGSSNTDMIVTIDHLPKPGETVIGGAFSMAAGRGFREFLFFYRRFLIFLFRFDFDFF